MDTSIDGLVNANVLSSNVTGTEDGVIDLQLGSVVPVDFNESISNVTISGVPLVLISVPVLIKAVVLGLFPPIACLH